MAREITSKHIDGITDLVVVAPIREGFIDAYENVTYATRARIVAEALHNVRVNAREYEKNMPFSDTAERILNLLNYRIGVLDQDLFHLSPESGLQSRRYLFLAVTFDGAWEPYMRLVWRPLGYFLDVVFCNCEDYTPAGDSSFEDYARWVRSVQVDSAIFYSTTGLTVRDQVYLGELERIQRKGDPVTADAEIAKLVVADPQTQAANEREKAPERAFTLALEALTVLYRLADYYPPDRLDPNRPGPGESTDRPDGERCRSEGRYLLRAARSLLDDFKIGEIAARSTLPDDLRSRFAKTYGEAIAWFENTAHLHSLERPEPEPKPDDSNVQAGILSAIGTDARPVREGALLLMTVTDPKDARAFLEALKISYEGDQPDGDFYRTIAFTVHGLRRIGLHEWKRKGFPKEFREGMERRSGLIGDFRENHPRSWELPPRNWPIPKDGEATRDLPPVDMAEIDFIIQLRYAPAAGNEDAEAVLREVERIAAKALESGAVLAAWEPMWSNPIQVTGQSAQTFNHFGFRDGISQPELRGDSPKPREGEYDNKVARGELLLGYGNDRGDAPPPKRFDKGVDIWPEELMHDGSFLVIRKLEQDVQRFEAYLEKEAARISEVHKIRFEPDDLRAVLLGRRKDGTPLIPPGPKGDNDFDFKGPNGANCPLGAHIRRANPRNSFQKRPAPRLMRRGMSYGARDGEAGPRGVMFMAYCASIAEQYETIQRWINGGNSTGQSSAQNDPLMGVRPARGPQVFSFLHQGEVIRTVLPEEPFVSLRWGLYLFAPSRAALNYMVTKFNGGSRDIDSPLEARGQAMIDTIEGLPPKLQMAEWRRILEDFDTKDPAESDRAPDIWSAIRYYDRGAYRIAGAHQIWWDAIHVNDPNPTPMPKEIFANAPAVVLVASQKLVCDVLSLPEIFSVELQGKRMAATTGDIYVAMQPGDKYWHEARATSQIMFDRSEAWGFADAFAEATKALHEATALARNLRKPFAKIELRRDLIAPTLASLCEKWFGVPDGMFMEHGGWAWGADARKPRCPGDFMAPSRNAFYPVPNEPAQAYAALHGPAILDAGRKFVALHAPDCVAKATMPGNLARKMADAILADPIPYSPAQKQDLLARNLIGMMIGMLPPIDGNLRGILYEWLNERTLWRHQGALLRALGAGEMTYEVGKVLEPPVTRAMCKRPSPDFLYRKATRDYTLTNVRPRDNVEFEVRVKKGDIVIVSLVSAAQRSLADSTPNSFPNGNVNYVFGGERDAVDNGKGPFHACPAKKMMMGTIIGIMAALLNYGRIKALPSSLIVELSGWRVPLPPEMVSPLPTAEPAASSGERR